MSDKANVKKLLKEETDGFWEVSVVPSIKGIASTPNKNPYWKKLETLTTKPNPAPLTLFSPTKIPPKPKASNDWKNNLLEAAILKANEMTKPKIVDKSEKEAPEEEEEPEEKIPEILPIEEFAKLKETTKFEEQKAKEEERRLKEEEEQKKIIQAEEEKRVQALKEEENKKLFIIQQEKEQLEKAERELRETEQKIQAAKELLDIENKKKKMEEEAELERQTKEDLQRQQDEADKKAKLEQAAKLEEAERERLVKIDEAKDLLAKSEEEVKKKKEELDKLQKDVENNKAERKKQEDERIELELTEKQKEAERIKNEAEVKREEETRRAKEEDETQKQKIVATEEQLKKSLLTPQKIRVGGKSVIVFNSDKEKSLSKLTENLNEISTNNQTQLKALTEQKKVVTKIAGQLTYIKKLRGGAKPLQTFKSPSKFSLSASSVKKNRRDVLTSLEKVLEEKTTEIEKILQENAEQDTTVDEISTEISSAMANVTLIKTSQEVKSALSSAKKSGEKVLVETNSIKEQVDAVKKNLADELKNVTDDETIDDEEFVMAGDQTLIESPDNSISTNDDDDDELFTSFEIVATTPFKTPKVSKPKPKPSPSSDSGKPSPTSISATGTTTPSTPLTSTKGTTTIPSPDITVIPLEDEDKTKLPGDTTGKDKVLPAPSSTGSSQSLTTTTKAAGEPKSPSTFPGGGGTGMTGFGGFRPPETSKSSSTSGVVSTTKTPEKTPSTELPKGVPTTPITPTDTSGPLTPADPLATIKAEKIKEHEEALKKQKAALNQNLNRDITELGADVLANSIVDLFKQYQTPIANLLNSAEFTPHQTAKLRNQTKLNTLRTEVDKKTKNLLDSAKTITDRLTEETKKVERELDGLFSELVDDIKKTKTVDEINTFMVSDFVKTLEKYVNRLEGVDQDDIDKLTNITNSSKNDVQKDMLDLNLEVRTRLLKFLEVRYGSKISGEIDELVKLIRTGLKETKQNQITDVANKITEEVKSLIPSSSLSLEVGDIVAGVENELKNILSLFTARINTVYDTELKNTETSKKTNENIIRAFFGERLKLIKNNLTLESVNNPNLSGEILTNDLGKLIKIPEIKDMEKTLTDTTAEELVKISEKLKEGKAKIEAVVEAQKIKKATNDLTQAKNQKKDELTKLQKEIAEALDKKEKAIVVDLTGKATKILNEITKDLNTKLEQFENSFKGLLSPEIDTFGKKSLEKLRQIEGPFAENFRQKEDEVVKATKKVSTKTSEEISKVFKEKFSTLDSPDVGMVVVNSDALAVDKIKEALTDLIERQLIVPITSELEQLGTIFLANVDTDIIKLNDERTNMEKAEAKKKKDEEEAKKKKNEEEAKKKKDEEEAQKKEEAKKKDEEDAKEKEKAKKKKEEEDAKKKTDEEKKKNKEEAKEKEKAKKKKEEEDAKKKTDEEKKKNEEEMKRWSEFLTTINNSKSFIERLTLYQKLPEEQGLLDFIVKKERSTKVTLEYNFDSYTTFLGGLFGAIVNSSDIDNDFSSKLKSQPTPLNNQELLEWVRSLFLLLPSRPPTKIELKKVNDEPAGGSESSPAKSSSLKGTLLATRYPFGASVATNLTPSSSWSLLHEFFDYPVKYNMAFSFFIEEILPKLDDTAEPVIPNHISNTFFDLQKDNNLSFIQALQYGCFEYVVHSSNFMSCFGLSLGLAEVNPIISLKDYCLSFGSTSLDNLPINLNCLGVKLPFEIPAELAELNQQQWNNIFYSTIKSNADNSTQAAFLEFNAILVFYRYYCLLLPLLATILLQTKESVGSDNLLDWVTNDQKKVPEFLNKVFKGVKQDIALYNSTTQQIINSGFEKISKAGYDNQLSKLQTDIDTALESGLSEAIIAKGYGTETVSGDWTERKPYINWLFTYILKSSYLTLKDKLVTVVKTLRPALSLFEESVTVNSNNNQKSASISDLPYVNSRLEDDFWTSMPIDVEEDQ